MSFQAMAEAVKAATEKPTDKLVLLMLANYADENNQAYPSYKRLAEDCCMSERGIKVIIGRLRKAGLISWVRRKKNDDSKELTSNLYTLHLENITPLNTKKNQGSAKHAPLEHEKIGGSEQNAQNTIKEPINKNLTTTEKIDFESFAFCLVEVVKAMLDEGGWVAEGQPLPKDAWLTAKANSLYDKFKEPDPADCAVIVLKDWTRNLSHMNKH